MRAKVTWWSDYGWNQIFPDTFGISEKEHDLPDNSEDLLKFLAPFGRFEAHPPGTQIRDGKPVDCWIIEFQNDYD